MNRFAKQWEPYQNPKPFRVTITPDRLARDVETTKALDCRIQTPSARSSEGPNGTIFIEFKKRKGKNTMAIEIRELEGLNNFDAKGNNNYSTAWEAENNFYWHSKPSRIGKLLAHYELYKSIVHLPGDILEFGVFKGASLIRFSTFRRLIENDDSRRIIGFDSFGEFPVAETYNQLDRDFIKNFGESCGDGLSRNEVINIFSEKGFQNVELIEGNILESLPSFLVANPATRIALFHLDMDVHEPTKFALELLYDRVVPGGLILFDDFGMGLAEGETSAVEQFVREKGLRLEKSPYCRSPAFIRKST